MRALLGAGLRHFWRSTVSPLPPVNTADVARLIQEVVAGMSPLGVAHQAAEEAARPVSSQNDARWQELQARMSAIEGGSVVSGGPASMVSDGAHGPRDRSLGLRHAPDR